MKRSLLFVLSFLALPLQAEVRGALRGGMFDGNPVGAVELDVRRGAWAFAPAFELIQGGYALNATHVDVRRLFKAAHNTFWVGAGPTFIHSSVPASKTTWNADAGFQWRTNRAWEPFAAARYYTFRMPIFRDVIEGSGVEISIGISRRIP